jgi:hypothetical protein
LKYKWLGYAENTNRSKKSQALSEAQDDVFVVSWRCKKPAPSQISIVCQAT